jgi:hypothetical protein
MTRFACVLFGLIAAVVANASAVDPPATSKRYLGDLTGTVVKVDKDSITVSITTVVQNGTTRQRMGGRRGKSVSVPKLESKLVEETIPLGDKVGIKTVSGKVMKLEDVQVGSAARLHVYNVTVRVVGEKPETHYEVERIDIPNPPKAGGAIPPPPPAATTPPKKK